MNFPQSFAVVFLMVIFNIIVYLIFIKYILGKTDAGMKFLGLNIIKDIIWVIISLAVLEKTDAHFLLIVICFIISSVSIYFPVIKRINKS